MRAHPRDGSMKKPLLLLPVFGLLGAMALPAAAQDADTVVATVGKTEITIGHMIIAHESLPAEYQSLPNETLFRGILDQLIQQTILAQSLGENMSKRVALAVENERRSLRAGEAVESVLGQEITEAQIQAAYEKRFKDAPEGEEFNASHILLETQEDALAVVAELEAGAAFEAIARAKSTGPSGPNGGNLGWFGTGAMVPTFEAAVIALKIGEVSQPVQTQFGWHVITLNDVRSKSVPSLDEMRADLQAEMRRAAVEARIAELTAKTEINEAENSGIDPAILKDLTLVK